MGTARAALSCLNQRSKERSVTRRHSGCECNREQGCCNDTSVPHSQWLDLLQALTFTLVAAYSLADNDNGQHSPQLTHQASNRLPLRDVFG